MTRSSFLSLVLLLLVPLGALAGKMGTLARDTEPRERANPIVAVVTDNQALSDTLVGSHPPALQRLDAIGDTLARVRIRLR